MSGDDIAAIAAIIISSLSMIVSIAAMVIDRQTQKTLEKARKLASKTDVR